MLHHYRRNWALFAAFLLALPLLAGILPHSNKTKSDTEARLLAPAPAFPADLAGWRTLPRQTDAYLQDHFGLRSTFLQAYAWIMSRTQIQTGKPLVLTGSNGQMFFRRDNMLQQSAGLIRRDEWVAGVADLLAKVRTVLADHGARLLVAPPPNASTIYPDQLPWWARNRGQRTEYDVFMSDLAARGVLAVDLRPIVTAAAAEGKAYRLHDTHWTARGAMAAFNAIVQADSHPDWTFDPAVALTPPETIAGGDLARLAGADDVTEQVQFLALPQGNREALENPGAPFAPYLATSGHPGPTIMIIGDSFTESLLTPMLLQHAGRMVWIFHNLCRFDWKWIDQFRPDEVWYMPNERLMVCERGNHPTGMPP
jgi:alginate O-acetyltransferase complex protein AlgJ